MRRNPYAGDKDGKRAFCIIGILWLVSLIVSLLISTTCIAALAAVAYYFLTGEHLLK